MSCVPFSSTPFPTRNELRPLFLLFSYFATGRKKVLNNFSVCAGGNRYLDGEDAGVDTVGDGLGCFFYERTCLMNTIRSLVVVVVMVVMVAVAGPMGRAHAAEKSGSKPSTPVMGQSMETTTAKPAAKIKAKPADKNAAKPADKNAVKKERKQKAQGDTRGKNGKNAGGRGKAA